MVECNFYCRLTPLMRQWSCNRHYQFLWRVALGCVGDDGIVLIKIWFGWVEVEGWMVKNSIHPSVDVISSQSCSHSWADATPLSTSIFMANGAVLSWWWWYCFDFNLIWLGGRIERWRDGFPPIYPWLPCPVHVNWWMLLPSVSVYIVDSAVLWWGGDCN